ncbi:protein tramtrack, beta isoform-like isoform X4 [Ctenocephalides felis]|uniref:protein tramtrack, beta isoform-like isoform X4 n=1 Tax=Ctenocephalides felis TaxID=7515 RepID=UPI000E6E2171|nr:protein tramtrack, beta isoform-like isoform X4 [Ctenocephalides felis]
MDAEQFSLKWNNFHSNLTSGFHALLRGEDLVDVTFAVEGKFLQAHKLVLSVCSPYFKQMFKIHPDKHPIIILKGVAYSDMSDILLFMYQGEVNVRQENLANFLKTAELLQIKGLTEDESSNDNPKPDATNEKDNTSESLTQYMYQDKQKNDTSTINSSSNLQNDAPKRPVVSPPANSETKRLKVANKPEENALVEPTDMTFIPKTEPNFMDEDYESSSMGDFTQIMESAQKDMNMASSGMSPLASSVLQDSSQLLDHGLTHFARNNVIGHKFIKPEGRGRKKIRMCLGCYTDLRKTLTYKDAHHNSRRVTSYCFDCEHQPGFCSPCFQKFHIL